MTPALPFWIEALFLLAFCFTIVAFYYSNGKAKKTTLLIIGWSILHASLAYTGFYQNTTAMPPRFALILIPSILLIIYGLLPKQQKWFLEVRNHNISSLLHGIRLPIEIVLFGLFTNEMTPKLMTFEGRNFDIIMGITAPIIYVLLVKKYLSLKGLLAWNTLGLILILFVFGNGILSSELPFQQFGFEQPNKGVTYFPFVLLPATIVPIVIWTHVSDIIKIKAEIKKEDLSNT